jgi:hypothetical protein
LAYSVFSLIRNMIQNSKQFQYTVQQPLIFGTRSTQVSFRVPQSVQKVEFRDSHKSLGFFEQQQNLFNLRV